MCNDFCCCDICTAAFEKIVVIKILEKFNCLWHILGLLSINNVVKQIMTLLNKVTIQCRLRKCLHIGHLGLNSYRIMKRSKKC